VLRRALPAAVVVALACSGAASAYLLGGPSARAAGTTGTTTATTVGTTTTSAARTTIVLTGHGWGHGLGMSQWGAYGYAKHGWTYDRILAHYFAATTLGSAPIATVRVLLLEKKKSVALSSTTEWRVTDAEGAKQPLAPGKLVLGPRLRVEGKELAAPLTFAPGKTPLLVANKPYRGRLVVRSDGKKLQVVDVLGLEAYLKGVVASEMPSAWSAEALKAQAVAARSYALANVAAGREFDLYGDTRSQVYGGIAAESPTTSQAVDATKGQVVLYAGKVASTMFFSTSGGRTVSAGEVTGRTVPYLVSVADPYDSASPYHDWGPVLLDAAKVARQLKVAGPLIDLTTTLGPSGRVQTATAVTPLTEVTLTGPALRAALGLRSTWFDVAWLALTPPSKAVTYGGAATVTGVARFPDAVSLESRVPPAEWAPAGAVTSGSDGSFSLVVRPTATTQYRLAAGKVRAAQITVPVAPLVRAAAAPGTVTGTIRPAIAGAAVQVQRQDGTLWTTVATTTTDLAGAFTVVQELEPGVYRVRCAPGHGLAPGVSPPLQV
jgi:stage II sporulation protein D